MKKMSRKGNKNDDLLEAIQDDKVIALLVERLTPIVEAVFKSLASNFESSLSQLMGKMEVLEKKFDTHVVKSLEPVNSRLTALEEDNKSLRRKVEELETHSRLDNLVIHGLEDSSFQESHVADSSLRVNSFQKKQASLNAVLSLCQSRLGLELSKSDVSAVHPLPRKNSDHCPALVVRFATRFIRDSVFFARGRLGQTTGASGSAKIYINEHLTRENAIIFAQARKMARDKAIFATWTTGGYTFIRHTDASQEKPKKILSLQDLDQFREL